MTDTSFGEHAALVSEVLDFAKEGRLLVPGAPTFHCRLLRSLDSATDYAWRRTNRGDTWTDLREREVAHVKGVGYREPKLNEVRSDLRRVNDEYFQVIKRRLGVRYRELSSDVHADLMNCALKRAFLGPAAGFLEDMFAVYQSGGWPCGWEGKPWSHAQRGHFVVFYPDEV